MLGGLIKKVGGALNKVDKFKQGGGLTGLLKRKAQQKPEQAKMTPPPKSMPTITASPLNKTRGTGFKPFNPKFGA